MLVNRGARNCTKYWGFAKIVFSKFFINIKIHGTRFSIFIVIGRFKIGVEVPVGSVPDIVNDIVPLNVAELPLKLRFKRLKLISRCLCSPISLGPPK
jgi:hypothetical protein